MVIDFKILRSSAKRRHLFITIGELLKIIKDKTTPRWIPCLQMLRYYFQPTRYEQNQVPRSSENPKSCDFFNSCHQYRRHQLKNFIIHNLILSMSLSKSFQISLKFINFSKYLIKLSLIDTDVKSNQKIF